MISVENINRFNGECILYVFWNNPIWSVQLPCAVMLYVVSSTLSTCRSQLSRSDIMVYTSILLLSLLLAGQIHHPAHLLLHKLNDRISK